MVNLDESESMIDNLSISIQYLTNFIHRIYGYHIQSIQGLVSFNNQVKVKCPLSPLVSDFEDKGLNNLKPESTTRLYDSLVRSCDELVKSKKDRKGRELYKNAQLRILVISGSDDDNSNAEVEDVVKELIKNKIIVDSVIINSKADCKMLCAVCHATGGFSLRIESALEGISLFEQSAFLKIEERKFICKPLVPGDRSTIFRRLAQNLDTITAELMNNAKENAEFDTEIISKDLYLATLNARLATPRHICAKNANTEVPYQRQKLILKELHVAAEVNDPSNESNFDPDMKIYTFQSNLDRWTVFLKGPEGTPYENKWWYLFISFPDLYPAQPPFFRFVSVPYHINVSSDGRICFNIIGKDYVSSMHVVDIIQQIKELLILPNIDTPVQLDAYYMFKSNQIQYDKLARESAEKNARNSIEDYIGSSKIYDEVPEDVEVYDEIPFYMKACQNCRQLVASSKNPICVITGKVLTERPEDLDDSK